MQTAPVLLVLLTVLIRLLKQLVVLMDRHLRLVGSYQGCRHAVPIVESVFQPVLFCLLKGVSSLLDLHESLRRERQSPLRLPGTRRRFFFLGAFLDWRGRGLVNVTGQGQSGLLLCPGLAALVLGSFGFGGLICVIVVGL